MYVRLLQGTSTPTHAQAGSDKTTEWNSNSGRPHYTVKSTSPSLPMHRKHVYNVSPQSFLRLPAPLLPTITSNYLRSVVAWRHDERKPRNIISSPGDVYLASQTAPQNPSPQPFRKRFMHERTYQSSLSAARATHKVRNGPVGHRAARFPSLSMCLQIRRCRAPHTQTPTFSRTRRRRACSGGV